MALIPFRDMSLIHPLPDGSAPPLTDQTVSTVRYGQTIHMMRITGFHCWSFVVVRTAPYNDANNEL
jgi:hypothetical protein